MGKPLPYVVLALLGLACAAPDAGVEKSSALDRAERRSFDGAPPVIPHDRIGADCVACHNERGLEVAELGFAPPSPHELTTGMSAISLCTQCHVTVASTTEFAGNSFEGLRQDLRRGRRLNRLAPPTIPHKTFMRENCVACHSGPAAREPIRTDHPERANCRQCHLAVTTQALFEPAATAR